MANHANLSHHAGLTVKYYKYYDYKNKKLDFDGMINDMEKAPGCAHNPTGTHLTEEQWKEVYDIIKKTTLIIF